MTMPRKRKKHRKPQKLTKYFTQRQHGGRQDGTSSLSTPSHKTHSLSSKSASGNRNSGSPKAKTPARTHLNPAAPLKLDSGWMAPDAVRRPDLTLILGGDTRELPDCIEEFPTMNQPVMDTVLKDIFLSLRSTLQADMMSCMQNFNKDIQVVESRVDHIETKMGEFASTINDLVDAHDGKEEEMEWIKLKMADLSQYTLQKKKSLTTITKALGNHRIKDRWGVPKKNHHHQGWEHTHSGITVKRPILTEGMANHP